MTSSRDNCTNENLNLSKCQEFTIIKTILSQNMINNYNGCTILNSFYHLINRHKFNDVYNNIKNHSKCNYQDCQCIQRNNRNRSEITKNDSIRNTLYCTGDSKKVIYQQIIDNINYFFLHSRELRFVFNINASSNDENNDDIRAEILKQLQTKNFYMIL